MSTMPGATTWPVTSMVRAARSSTSPTATMRPSRRPTSARCPGRPVPSTTVPPVSTRSSTSHPSRRCRPGYVERAGRVARRAGYSLSTIAGMPEGLRISHVDDIEWTEVRVQTDGTRRRSVWNRFIEMSPERSVMYTRYDPGFILAKHSHVNTEIIFVVEGDLMVGDHHCPAGSCIILDAETMFGPLVAGENGVHIFEVFGEGTFKRHSADEDEWREMLNERGITALPDPEFTIPPPPK